MDSRKNIRKAMDFAWEIDRLARLDELEVIGMFHVKQCFFWSEWELGSEPSTTPAGVVMLLDDGVRLRGWLDKLGDVIRVICEYQDDELGWVQMVASSSLQEGMRMFCGKWIKHNYKRRGYLCPLGGTD